MIQTLTDRVGFSKSRLKTRILTRLSRNLRPRLPTCSQPVSKVCYLPSHSWKVRGSREYILKPDDKVDAEPLGSFKELRHKTALFQDSVVAEVGEHIDAIIKAKEHTANSLKSIRALAETQ